MAMNYQVRWENDHQDGWSEVFAYSPTQAAAEFAEDCDAEGGELVRVKGRGVYKIDMHEIVEYEYSAEKVKGK